MAKNEGLAKSKFKFCMPEDNSFPAMAKAGSLVIHYKGAVIMATEEDVPMFARIMQLFQFNLWKLQIISRILPISFSP